MNKVPKSRKFTHSNAIDEICIGPLSSHKNAAIKVVNWQPLHTLHHAFQVITENKNKLSL